MDSRSSGSSRPAYLLSLQTLVAAMKESPTVISLSARLPRLVSLPAISQQACVARVIVGQGMLHACHITTDSGHLLLQHKAACAVLEQVGELEWHLQPAASASPASPAHSASPTHPAPLPFLPNVQERPRQHRSLSPTGTPEKPGNGEPGEPGKRAEAGESATGRPSRRVPTLTPVQMQVLSHAQRRVFALVDGCKTTEQIARVLSKSPHEVQQILHDLHVMHLITF